MDHYKKNFMLIYLEEIDNVGENAQMQRFYSKFWSSFIYQAGEVRQIQSTKQ